MTKIFFYQTSGSKVRGIVIVPIPGQDKPAGKKYEYIDNSPKGVPKFCLFAKRKFPAATHINFYCRKTGQYIDRIELE